MAFSVGYDVNEARLLLTLCEFSYSDEDPLSGETLVEQRTRMVRDINAALAASPYADWRVVWGPGLSDDRANMLFVVNNIDTNQYAVVIRGTSVAFVEDWLQDVGALLGLVPLTDVVPAAPAVSGQIAKGTAAAFQILAHLVGTTLTGQQMDLVTFLLPLVAAGADVFVTGHSLGGCLATVIAPWLACAFGDADHLKVYTFAAPSAGNGAFANYFNARFMHADGQHSTAYRVYNDLDVVPTAWASLADVKGFYNPAPPCPELIEGLIDAAQAVIQGNYVQPGVAGISAIRLHGGVLGQVPAAVFPLFNLLNFRDQVERQHAPLNYMGML
jgi:hypothetical protein